MILFLFLPHVPIWHAVAVQTKESDQVLFELSIKFQRADSKRLKRDLGKPKSAVQGPESRLRCVPSTLLKSTSSLLLVFQGTEPDTQQFHLTGRGGILACFPLALEESVDI